MAKLSKEEKSTVVKIRENTTWGKIMYNACYIFNKNLSDYLLEYCVKFDDGEVLGNLENAMRQANVELVNLKAERKTNDEVVASCVQNTMDLYKQYWAAKIPESVVANYRRGIGDNEDYARYIQIRKQAYNRYHNAVQERKIAEKKRIDFNFAHSYESKRITNRITAIKRKMAIQSASLQHSICEDFELLNNFILSEAQCEKLMGLLLSILSLNTGNAFITQLTDLEREKVCEKLYDYLNEFNHIYDFATGCYMVKNNTLVLKPMATLSKTLYNGYYITLKGYCLRSFMQIVKEREMVTSVYELYPQDEEGNDRESGFDRVCDETTMSSIRFPSSKIDEGTIDIWVDIANEIKCRKNEVALKIKSLMQLSLPNGNYYESDEAIPICENALFGALDGIMMELQTGKHITSKIRNVVFDSVGGVESKQELDNLVVHITNVIKSCIREYFEKEKTDELLLNN